MKRIQKYTALLQALKEANGKTRVAIVKSAPPDFIKALIEIVHNFLRGNVPLSSPLLCKLKKHKCRLRQFGRCRGAKGIERARHSLQNQKGGLFPLLIPIIAGLSGLAGAGTAAGIAAATVPKIARNAARSGVQGALDTVEEKVKKLLK